MSYVHKEEKLDFNQVMMVPRYRANGPKSRSEVNLLTTPNHLSVLPIIAANMNGVGTMDMCRSLSKFNALTALYKHYKVEELLHFYHNDRSANYSIYSMGATAIDKAKYAELVESLDKLDHHAKPYAVCIDVANGYTDRNLKFINEFHREYPKTLLMAGNVVTIQGVHQMVQAGANIIKIGIGPGSVCTTRHITGIGYPQFSAVMECVQATYRTGIKIVSDGGCTCPGDVAKAFGAGAHYVMLGGMLAGHNEGLPPGQLVAGKDMEFFGMSSKTAQDLYNGGVADYRASEGKTVRVPYRGPVKDTMTEIAGGLRSACTYLGIADLADIGQDTEFVKVNATTNNVFGAPK